MSEAHDWFATTPVVAHVRQGIVLAALSGEPAASAANVLGRWGIAGALRE